MDYAQRQRSPGKHLASIAAVVILHVLVLYALVNSSLPKIAAIIQAPIEIKIIEEIRKPPPDNAPSSPPPKIVKLPPAFVPPPEVQIQAPVEPQATIVNITNVVAAVEQVPPGRGRGRGVGRGAGVGKGGQGVGVACPNSQQIRSEVAYPEQALREKLEGSVLIEFTLMANGSIKDIDILSSSDRAFNNVSVSAVRQFVCTSQGSDVRVAVPFVFKLNN
jgi:protein TonB